MYRICVAQEASVNLRYYSYIYIYMIISMCIYIYIYRERYISLFPGEHHLHGGGGRAPPHRQEARRGVYVVKFLDTYIYIYIYIVIINVTYCLFLSYYCLIVCFDLLCIVHLLFI